MSSKSSSQWSASERDVASTSSCTGGGVAQTSVPPTMETVTIPINQDGIEKKISLPRQLLSVAKATEIPKERHRWNTNEELAAILIAFSEHEKWERDEVVTRPPSGSMLMYNRKKVSFRRDGYFWKKRKDGKITREDHMKLKIGGAECIYGCYVHSALLPTFHRRCYWLLQNPDIVLVHYLNVPVTDDRIIMPSMYSLDQEEWKEEDLVQQLRPMFATESQDIKIENHSQMTEDIIKNIVKHFVENAKPRCPDKNCGKSSRTCKECTPERTDRPIQQKTDKNQTQNIKLKSKIQPNVQFPRKGSMPVGSGYMLQSNKDNKTPFILNLSQFHGSTGLIILSSGNQTSNNGSNNVTQLAQPVVKEEAGAVSILAPPRLEVGPQFPQQSGLVSIAPQPQQDPQQRQPTEGSLNAQLRHGNPSDGALTTQIHQQVALSTSESQPGGVCVPVTHQHNLTQLPGAQHVQAVQNLQGVQQQHIQQIQGVPQQIQAGHQHIHQQSIQSVQQQLQQPSVQGVQQQLQHQHIQNNHQKSQMVSLLNDSVLNNVKHRHANDQVLFNNQHNTSHNHTMDTHLLNVANTNNSQGLVNDLALPHGTPSNVEIETMTTNLGNSQMLVDSTSSLDAIVQDFSAISSDMYTFGSNQNNSLVSTGGPTLKNAGSSKMHGSSQNMSAMDAIDIGALPDTTDFMNNFDICDFADDVLGVNASQGSNMADAKEVGSQNGGGGGGSATISDFSPEWAFPNGGNKILVTGPWFADKSTYTVLFDDISVQATFVQSGVLRCIVPAHNPGLVTLQVVCDGIPISNSCLFEYKAKELTVAERQRLWFSVSEDKLKISLVERLEELQKKLLPEAAARVETSTLTLALKDDIHNRKDTLEGHLVEFCDNLKCGQWSETNSALKSHFQRLTLLHMAASLGFGNLINALIELRSLNKSSVLEQEIDAQSLDDNACTPVIWACACGRLDAVRQLFEFNPSCLNVCNKDGLLPLSVAHSHGFMDIVKLIESLEKERVDRLVEAAASAKQQQTPAKAYVLPILIKQPNSSTTSQSCHTTSIPASMVTAPMVTTTSSTPVYITAPNSRTGTPIPRPGTHSAPNSRTGTPTAPNSRTGTPIRQLNPKATSTYTPTVAALEAQAKALKGNASARAMLKQGHTGDLRIEIPASPGLKTTQHGDSLPASLQGTPKSKRSSEAQHGKRSRLLKRISVEVLPDYPSTTNSEPKAPRNAPFQLLDIENTENQNLLSDLNAASQKMRTVNSDSHLAIMTDHQTLIHANDPMISMNSRDLNSPDMFMQTDWQQYTHGLTLEDIQRGNVTAMDTDSLDCMSHLTPDRISPERDGEHGSNQMAALANQIIEAMPDRIKLSPSRCVEDILIQEEISRRDRSSSYGSFSSCSSLPGNPGMTPPSLAAEDSGISTPLEGMAFEDYRYPSSLENPASCSSPAGSGLDSPYSFNLDSPPPTTQEFHEYFNAPSYYLEKDFSQLTLSDTEQRKLYEAAQIIQSFYRKYKDRKEQQLRQRQKELEAAVLIQNYYRRYKQYIYSKKMTQAAVLIQSQFRSYYAQKRFKQSREAATVIQNRYRTYKEQERFRRSKDAAVLIQQRFRSHYRRKRSEKQSGEKLEGLRGDTRAAADKKPGSVTMGTTTECDQKQTPSRSSTIEHQSNSSER